MFFVSPVLKRLVYPSLAATGYLRKRRMRQISILTYHGVLPQGYTVKDQFLDGTLLPSEFFRRQLRLLQSCYNVLSPEEFLHWLGTDRELPERAALLTCDDGLLNNVTEMLPVLQEEKLSCLFFVTGASVANPYTMLWYVELYLMLGQLPPGQFQITLENSEVGISLRNTRERHAAWLELLKKMSRFDGVTRKALLDDMRSRFGLAPDWKARYLEDPVLRKRFCVMGISELKQLAQGGMFVGAHTVTHPIPSQQPPELLRAEMLAGRELLENALGLPIRTFAYPFGDEDSVSEREFNLAEQVGFECAFRNVGGTLRSRVRVSALPRIHISSDMNLGEFEAHVSGFHQELRERLHRGLVRTAQMQDTATS